MLLLLSERNHEGIRLHFANECISSVQNDKLGDKISAVGRAATNQWAAKRDRVLLEKLRHDLEERAVKERKKHDEPRSFSRILCAIDFGSNSLEALDLAKQIAFENGSSLFVVHVCPSSVMPLAAATAAEENARWRLKEVATRQLSGMTYEILVTTGDAAAKIIKIQTELGIGLIVLGTYGRRGLPRFFLGSVADKVVRTASCPVLTMRGR